MRINQFLARSGVASRRKAEQMIKDGSVTVNGRVTTDLALRIDPAADAVRCEGRALSLSEGAYLLLHKPAGYISAVSDARGRPVVLELVRDYPGKVVPVGRLDLDTTGCLLLSNDGAFIQRMLHPRYGIKKTYQVRVKGRATPEALARLRCGVMLEEGLARADAVAVLKREPEGAWLEIVIHQGWKRQVKRMCAAAGLTPRALHRGAIAFLTLESLPEGASRRLAENEVRRLTALAQRGTKS